MTHEQVIETQAAERYLLGEMTESEHQAFESHYFDCADCAEEIRVGVRLVDAVRTIETEWTADILPFALAARVARSRLSPFVQVAAAAALALVVAYQNLVVIPDLRVGHETRAVVPVMVRPSSRGEPPEIRLPGPSGPTVIALRST